MKVYITRNTSIGGKSVKPDLKKAVEVDDDVGWQLIGANKAVSVDSVKKKEKAAKEKSQLESLQEKFETAWKERDEAHAAELAALTKKCEGREAEIVALNEKHEAAIAELTATHAAEVEKLNQGNKQ